MIGALVPADVHEGDAETTDPGPLRREPLAWWKLAVGLAGAIGLIDLAQAVQGLTEVAVLVAGLAALGLAGWLWGADTRDGADWTNAPRP
jgi:hypothetical protein